MNSSSIFKPVLVTNDLPAVWPKVNALNTKFLSGWQKSSWDIGKAERWFGIQAFCGSGKTVLQIALAIWDVVSSNYTRKQLIIVPMILIGDGFAKERIKLGRKVYDFCPSYNFTDANPEKIALLVEWLLATPKQLQSKNPKSSVISGLACVATHRALALAWEKIEKRGLRAKAIRNLTLRVDEAHHIKQGAFDPFFINEDLTPEQLRELQDTGNKLGRIIDYICASKVKTSKLCFTTATFFRGDNCPIILQDVKERFKFFNLDWIDHWKTLGIKKLSFQYAEYKGSPVSEILRMVRENPGRKFLVIVPPSGQKWRKGATGERRLAKLARELKKLGVVCDLVKRDGLTVSQQTKNGKELLGEPKNADTESKIDIVLACNKVREGTDWVPCDFVINAAVESSSTVAIQTLGRPFRRFLGKDEVTIVGLVKKFVVPKKLDCSPRELLSDRTNMLLVLTMVHDMAFPVKLITPPGQTEYERAPNTLEELYEDLYPQLMAEFYELTAAMEDGEVTEELVDVYIDALLDTYPTPEEYRETAADALKIKFARHSTGKDARPPKLRTPLDAEYMRKMGFDKIVQAKNIYWGDLNTKDMARAYAIVRAGYPDLWNTDYDDFVYARHSADRQSNFDD